MKHVFEVFSGGCELCKNAIEILKNNIDTESEIIEYNLQAPVSEYVKKKVMKYEIIAVPSIIVDKNRKFVGIPNASEIKNLIS